MNKLLNVEIKTKRLVLRNMRAEDVSQDYINWLNDPSINQYLNTVIL